MEHSFEKAKELGYDTIIIFGNKISYISQEFKNCKKYDVSFSGKYSSAMFIKELIPNILTEHKWTYENSPVMKIDMKKLSNLMMILNFLG